MSKLNVLAIPAFDDNYLWLIHDGRHAVVVDPGAAVPILTALTSHRLSLLAILLTHHHTDHVGGVPALLEQYKVPVFGPRHDHIDCLTDPLEEGNHVHVAEMQLDFSVLDVPGHTRGHIAYVASKQGWLFCGDTLFGGGCGRLFEGTPSQMAASLAKLAALPDATQVYCAHEYTLSNLRFAHAVEPGNTALAARMVTDQARRDAGQPTIPSTIGLEKATNPFLRYQEPEIIRHLQAAGRLTQMDPRANPVTAFAALREWKNQFR